MPKWDYRQVSLKWDGTRKEWISQGGGLNPGELVGANALLAHHGDDGWKLVGVTATGYAAASEATRSAGGITGQAWGNFATTFVDGWIATGYTYY